MSAWLRRVHDHWFAPAPLEDLALARIVVVAMELALLLVPALARDIGACPGCSLGYQQWLTSFDPREFHPLPALKVLLLPFGWGARPDPMFLHAVWLAAVVAGLGALVGLYTRGSLLLFAASTTLLTAHAYSYGELHHPEAVLTVALWAFALAPSGARRSLDDLRFRVRHAVQGMRFEPRTAPTLSPHARWPLRLVQWLLVLIYLSAGYSKLVNGGPAWFNGYTLAFYVGDDAIERGSALGVWLAQHVHLLQIMSVGAILVELGFGAIMIWPRLAWAVVLAGVGLHTGIWVLQRAPFPQLVALYVVFVGELRAAWPFPRRAPASRRWTVIYDGLCPLCIRSMTVLDALDLRRRLIFLDLEREWDRAAAIAPGLTAERARHAMHVVGPEGQVCRGYFAFRALARALPPLWPLVPLTLLPFADRLGSAGYDLVARNRGRQVACRAESCTIPV